MTVCKISLSNLFSISILEWLCKSSISYQLQKLLNFFIICSCHGTQRSSDIKYSLRQFCCFFQRLWSTFRPACPPASTNRPSSRHTPDTRHGLILLVSIGWSTRVTYPQNVMHHDTDKDQKRHAFCLLINCCMKQTFKSVGPYSESILHLSSGTGQLEVEYALIVAKAHPLVRLHLQCPQRKCIGLAESSRTVCGQSWQWLWTRKTQFTNSTTSLNSESLNTWPYPATDTYMNLQSASAYARRIMEKIILWLWQSDQYFGGALIGICLPSRAPQV